MPRLIFLGTAAALPTSLQDNTSFMLENNGQYFMVDCSGMPYRKLLNLGVGINDLKHILITHAHVDHLYALPSLIDALGIAGRSETLHIYALTSTLQVIVSLLDLWDLRTRDYCNFPIVLHPIQGAEDEAVFQDTTFALRTTPTQHAIDSIASKFTFPNQPVLIYSSDTSPCDSLLRFAKGADYFLLECTYCNNNAELSAVTGHFYAAQFREFASQVAATKTILTHHSDAVYCTREQLLTEIGQRRDLPSLDLTVPRDFDVIELV